MAETTFLLRRQSLEKGVRGFKSHTLLTHIKIWEYANDGGLGQTVNLLLYGLIGSSPVIPTNFGKIAKLVNAMD